MVQGWHFSLTTSFPHLWISLWRLAQIFFKYDCHFLALWLIANMQFEICAICFNKFFSLVNNIVVRLGYSWVAIISQSRHTDTNNNTHIQTFSQLRVFPSPKPDRHVFKLWEEGKEPRENPERTCKLLTERLRLNWDLNREPNFEIINRILI